MKKIFLTIMTSLIMMASAQAAERESFYSERLCENRYKGYKESLGSGLRPDCQTYFSVIEIDWSQSPKHYECIGQALIYAQETNKTPVCVLLARDGDELSFGKGLDFSEFGIRLEVIDVRELDIQ